MPKLEEKRSGELVPKTPAYGGSGSPASWGSGKPLPNSVELDFELKCVFVLMKRSKHLPPIPYC